jgi:hypothetical protein
MVCQRVSRLHPVLGPSDIYHSSSIVFASINGLPSTILHHIPDTSQTSLDRAVRQSRAAAHPPHWSSSTWRPATTPTLGIGRMGAAREESSSQQRPPVSIVASEPA